VLGFVEQMGGIWAASGVAGAGEPRIEDSGKAFAWEEGSFHRASKLQVYQRSRWRSSKPLQSFGLSCMQSRGPMGPLPVSLVRLDFDGVGVDPCEAVSVPPSAMSLDSALSSVEVVPESVSGEVSADLGLAGVDSVVAEKLDRALAVGEVAGLTCEGQPGLLKEFLGQIVVDNHSRSAGGVRGSQVLNES
jgi:hypothetical protein